MGSPITIDKIGEILTLADNCRDEVVPCFIGPPGIGKTQSVRQWAEEHGRNMVEYIFSQRLPTEISGITMPVPETKSMEVFDYDRLANLEDGDILFFDELFEAPSATLSAGLTLIQERRMLSGRKLPDVLIVSATNPVPSPVQIKHNIRQRFMFYNTIFKYDIWVKYMLDKHGFIPCRILDFLEIDDDGNYNTFSPRTAEKLIKMGIYNGWKDSVFNAIDHLFDSMIGDAIIMDADDNMHMNAIVKQFLTAVIRNGLFDEIPSNRLRQLIMQRTDSDVANAMSNIIDASSTIKKYLSEHDIKIDEGMVKIEEVDINSIAEQEDPSDIHSEE